MNMFTKSKYRFSAQRMETFLTISGPWAEYCSSIARVAWAS